MSGSLLEEISEDLATMPDEQVARNLREIVEKNRAIN